MNLATERRSRKAGPRSALPALLLGVALLNGGCEMDSFFDPSIVGRWEATPVALPVLERLDVIDEPADELPGLSDIRSEDLIPEVREYVMGPGDLISVSIFELIVPNQETIQSRRIDELGYIRLPVVGQLKAAGLTTKQLEQRLIDILDPAILRNPMVTVIVQEGRQRTFSVIGASTGVGVYTIVESNFRLLDALAMARGVPTSIEKIHVVRQVPLVEEVEKGFQPIEADPGERQPPMQPSERPGGAQAAPGAPPATTDPAAVIDRLAAGLEQPESPATAPPKPADEAIAEPKPASPLSQALEQPGRGEGRFINIAGKWVWVEGPIVPAEAVVEGAEVMTYEGQLPPPDQLVTQRVIEIDSKALMRGEAKYNIVIRPGDIINIPPPPSGLVYMGGAIARPGPFALPVDGRLTLTRAIVAAGGLGPVAIPERVDLTRSISRNEQVTVRLNLRAIYEGVQPDFYLKPHDRIDVGTNVFAGFAAVIRNSFRMSYGFGFLLDRNFGFDVFGQSNQFRGNNLGF